MAQSFTACMACIFCSCIFPSRLGGGVDWPSHVAHAACMGHRDSRPVSVVVCIVGHLASDSGLYGTLSAIVRDMILAPYSYVTVCLCFCLHNFVEG